MEKISSIISKKVVSVSEGELIGYILNVEFDDYIKQVKNFIVVDDESEKTFLLSRNAIKSIGEDCVIVSSSQDLEICLDENTNNLVGKTVYDEKGCCLGKINDIILQGKYVKKVVTDKCEFLSKYIKSYGKNYVIYGNRRNKPGAKIISTKSIARAPIVRIEDMRDEGGLYQATGQTKPYRILANQNTIIGRIMIDDLYGLNNEIIARKNAVINQNIINRAKAHNKLNMLIYYSK